MKYLIFLLAQLFFIQVATAQMDSTVQKQSTQDTSVKVSKIIITSNSNQKLDTIRGVRIIIPPHRIIGPIRLLPIARRVYLQHYKDINKRQFELNEIPKLAVRNVESIAATAAGVIQTDIGLSFKGSKEDGTAFYLDGMRMIPDEIGEIQNNNLL